MDTYDPNQERKSEAAQSSGTGEIQGSSIPSSEESRSEPSATSMSASGQGPGEQELREAAERTREQGREIAGEVKEKAQTVLERQKSKASETLSEWSNALRRTADNLHEQHQETAGSFAEQAADRVAGVATALKERDLGDFVDQTENFARRQPRVFLGSALAAGFLLARFLKSSSSRRGELVGGQAPVAARYRTTH